MHKTIMVTGSTDGIGSATAEMLVSMGHTVLLHGRNPTKLKNVEDKLSALPGAGRSESFVADLSRLSEVQALAESVAAKHPKLDVLINNAGVYNAPRAITEDNLDIRFAVNTIAPFLLTRKLLPLLERSGRIVNLSSAAQSPVDPKALAGQQHLSDHSAYAQSKLALTMWSRELAHSLGDEGPAVIAVNPGSMLGSKMVKQAFGVAGGDIRIGAEILVRAALADEFADASGRYFDNDQGAFAPPHPHALDPGKCREIVEVMERILESLRKP